DERLGQGVGHLVLGRHAHDRCSASGPSRDEQQEVDAVAEQDDADDDARERALEHEVDARRDEHADRHDEGDGRAHLGHRVTPSGAAPGPTSWPSISPWRSISAPSERKMSSTRPITTRNTPTSKMRLVTMWISPSTGTYRSISRERNGLPVSTSETRPTPAERNSPVPSKRPGCTGAASPSS